MRHILSGLMALLPGVLLLAPASAHAQIGVGPAETRCEGRLRIEPFSMRGIGGSSSEPSVIYQARLAFTPQTPGRNTEIRVTFNPPPPVQGINRAAWHVQGAGHTTVRLGTERGFAPSIPSGSIIRHIFVECY